MKKFLALLMAVCMLLAAVPALADVAETVAAAADLTHDELVEKALAETGTFVVAGTAELMMWEMKSVWAFRLMESRMMLLQIR